VSTPIGEIAWTCVIAGAPTLGAVGATPRAVRTWVCVRAGEPTVGAPAAMPVAVKATACDPPKTCKAYIVGNALLGWKTSPETVADKRPGPLLPAPKTVPVFVKSVAMEF
jgi:hypothetical protein